ncbi:AGRB2-like protein [Mya arenaria]|uniref:AGRB2-like protein n=1 Tax=Mya arenaria TaxID=6604 RepID=A0ABY7ELL7_MYAAR|nr:AGRB2-like protein [Mya arenaria]
MFIKVSGVNGRDGLFDMAEEIVTGPAFNIVSFLYLVHISWGDWSAWSDCSQSCDRGRKSRHRSCNVPPLFTDGICTGDDTETEECVIHEFCPCEYIALTS